MRIFFSLLFSASLFAASAQTVVQVGTGTNVSPITNFAPVFRTTAGSSATFARSNMIYRTEQLQTAGLPQGQYITGLSFYKTNTSNLLLPGRVKIYLLNSTRNRVFTSDTWTNILTTHTLVTHDSSVVLTPTAGWQSFSVTPFLYTGGALEIAFESSSVPGSTGATGPIAWQWTGPADSTAMVGIQGTTFQDVMNSPSTGYRTLPNVQFTMVTATVLPLRFLSFIQRSGTGTLSFDYQLSNESLLRSLTLEGSRDGRQFVTLETAHSPAFTGSMTTTKTGYRYFRLLAMDANGKQTYSAVLEPPLIVSETSFRLISNPVGSSLRFRLTTTRSASAHFTITDGQGRLIKTTVLPLSEGAQQQTLFLPALPPGTYFLRWTEAAQTLSFQVR